MYKVNPSVVRAPVICPLAISCTLASPDECGASMNRNLEPPKAEACSETFVLKVAVPDTLMSWMVLKVAVPDAVRFWHASVPVKVEFSVGAAPIISAETLLMTTG
jgi:hypothetical protein